MIALVAFRAFVVGRCAPHLRRHSVSSLSVAARLIFGDIPCLRAESLQKNLRITNFAVYLQSRSRECIAEIAQLVERNLAKVKVAGPSPVFRSTFRTSHFWEVFLFCPSFSRVSLPLRGFFAASPTPGPSVLALLPDYRQVAARGTPVTDHCKAHWLAATLHLGLCCRGYPLYRLL